MSKPTKIIVDCTTGEQSIVELTNAEIAELESAQAAAVAEQERIKAEADAKAAAKISAQNKLKALGLSDAEVAALLN